MSKKLVIVESPKKAKTISKFLGDDYIVKSSYGHIRDLPRKNMGVELENKTYEPQYTIPKDKSKKVNELKKAAEKADEVIFATDEDREGEAISWHLAKIFDIDPEQATRIVFHEITKEAIEGALDNPRHIDEKLVDAQQARRVLDRLVGYELSPLLWKKVAKGLSAGRVQSVALRFIVDRERERQAFDPKEYWSLKAMLEKDKKELESKLHSKNDKKLKKFDISSKKEMDEVTKDLEDAKYKIDSIKEKERKRKPKAPYTTSTLQQDANNKLYFSSKKTMAIAQQLYEGIDIGDDHVGLITYMRTDSINLSKSFLGKANKFVENTFGDEFQKYRTYKTKSKNAQEAHEAIRPTDPFRSPKSIKDKLSKSQYKLYKLIWSRALATQMSNAKLKRKTITIKADKYGFRASGQTVIFPGWLKLYPQTIKEKTLPELEEGDKLKCNKLKPKQHFTKPPARYSDATLVKELKKHDIGRPSTYAPTISTLENRDYVQRTDNKRLKPNDIAFVVNDLLVGHFQNIVDSEFTADLEQELDNIASGDTEWKPVVSEFYEPFHENIEQKEEELSKENVTVMKEIGEHPETEKPIFAKVGQYGPYLQMGTKDDEQKPKFASLPDDVSVEEITLEQATKMLSLPRELGEDNDGNKIVVNKGKYGPYVKVEDEYYSIEEDDPSPFEINLKQAKDVIKREKEKKKKKEIQTFDKEGIKVLNGPYGPYVTDGNINAKIPDEKEPADLSLEDCKKLIEQKKK